MQEPHFIPSNDYQALLEHSLTLAHLLEHSVMFLPRECDLWHRSGVELMQYSSWINRKLERYQ